MANIYDIRRYATAAFMVISVAIVASFLYISNNLVKDLAAQERERMQIWANATKEIITASDIEFPMSIIEANSNIPVMLTDESSSIILDSRNFDLPEDSDPLSEVNAKFLESKLHDLKQTNNVIHVTLDDGSSQYVYYEDSSLLRKLNYFPYIQVTIMVVFILIVYFAVMSTKKAEQNKVWVGLSKETAHQLGTPISSLMAWMELLKSLGVDDETVKEMNKDVDRLSTIASRFSKIGSRPNMEPVDMNEVVAHSSSYMSTRISPHIKFTAAIDPRPAPVMMSAPLFEWVMENLIKNAVDAMSGTGSISVTTGRDKERAFVEVADTGKGISRKHFKTVFNPGYTTKKRGWGLGLTLAKRIIEEYHNGKIFVKQSEPGVGTTFRIEFQLNDTK
ncbi:MAG: ATP-binding protein [Muribaculaceae bacterium]|nr:ATP-binding protein [Muribaculaceae bacterium]